MLNKIRIFIYKYKLNDCFFSWKSRIILLLVIIFMIFYSRPNPPDNNVVMMQSSMRSFKRLYDRLNSSNNKLKIKKLIQECNPINDSNGTSQYKVYLDGITYPQFVSLHHNKSINYSCLNSKKTLKKILLWNTFFDYEDHLFGLGIRDPFKKRSCPVFNCELTNDRSELNSSDLVLVHMLNEIEEFDSKRNANQRFVFVLYDPFAVSSDFKKYNGKFNLTATYRSDSDFPGFYQEHSSMIWSLNETFDENYDFSQNKTKFAFAVISNCNKDSDQRIQLIKELQRHIEVDIYGSCGRECSNGLDCKSSLYKDYKFYLAFENSNCSDHISEKFHETLKHDIIPVVYGKGNYSFYTPKSAFVNSLDFKTPKALAEYLSYLSSNKIAYNSYFKWKRHVVFDQEALIYNPSICDMCIQLHLEDFYGVKSKSIHDLDVYWKKQVACNKKDTI